MALIQGDSWRAVWNKQLYRIPGTGVGLLLTRGLPTLPLDKWSVSLPMTGLSFMIETLVLRHCALAVVAALLPVGSIKNEVTRYTSRMRPLFGVLLLLSPSPAAHAEFIGTVVAGSAGDTITALRDKEHPSRPSRNQTGKASMKHLDAWPEKRIEGPPLPSAPRPTAGIALPAGCGGATHALRNPASPPHGEATDWLASLEILRRIRHDLAA